MHLPAEIFKAYDIRGVVGKTLTAPIVQRIGQALGTLALERGRDTLVVARDGRTSGPELGRALATGIQASGANVIDIGMVTTPMSYFAAHELKTQCSVMVTGSHNPPDYNGLKMVIAGDTLAGDEIQALKSRIESGALNSGAGSLRHADIVAAYFDRIAGDITLVRPMKIAVDCGNGIAGAFAPALFRRLGCEVTELFCAVDGTFPNHHPDPSQPKNLQDLIACLATTDNELGLAFDGDGDRLGVVTGDGGIIYPDRQLMLFAADMLARNAHATVIYDVKSTRNLKPWIVAHGGTPLLWKTGHSLIKQKMKQSGALLAGEMSGHTFFKERWYGFDDGHVRGRPAARDPVAPRQAQPRCSTPCRTACRPLSLTQAAAPNRRTRSSPGSPQAPNSRARRRLSASTGCGSNTPTASASPGLRTRRRSSSCASKPTTRSRCGASRRTSAACSAPRRPASRCRSDRAAPEPTPATPSSPTPAGARARRFRSRTGRPGSASPRCSSPYRIRAPRPASRPGCGNGAMPRKSATFVSTAVCSVNSSSLLNTIVCFAWNVAPQTLQLPGIEPAIDVGERLRHFQRQRAQTLRFGLEGLTKRQRLAPGAARHVPVRKGARDRIAQNDDEPHRRVVAGDALRRRRPVEIRRRRLAQQTVPRSRVETGAVRRVVDRLGGKAVVGIEEVQFLFLRQAQLGMLAQVVVERRRAALLRAGDDEAHLVERLHRG